MIDLNYKLDRTAFQALSFEEADREIKNSSASSLEQRIDHFNFLVSVAFRFVGEPWPRMDKKQFEMNKRS